jgi:hypothetical protein
MIRNGPPGTVGAVIDVYLRYLQLRVESGDLSPGSLETRGKFLAAFASMFGDKPLADAKRHDLTRFILEHPEWKSGWTKTGALGAVVSCFRWAEDEEITDRLIYRKPRSLRFTARPRQPMTVEVYVRIMRAASHGRGDKWGQRPDVEDLTTLRHGPYRPLRAKIGDVLTCSVWGCRVRVDGISSGPIPWPFTQQRRVGSHRGPKHLIVTGELERAIRQEEGVAVSHHWGTNIATVWTSQKALGVRGLMAGRRQYMRAACNSASARALRRALFFLRRTGCRTCELRAMRWRDVDWPAGVIRLGEHKTARATGDVRIIGMDAATLRFLRNLHLQAGPKPDDRHIFTNGRKKPLKKSALVALLRAYGRRAGVEGQISAYGLRHLFALTAVENNISDRAIADQMGWTTTKYLSHYSRQSRNHTTHLNKTTASILARPREKGGVA